MKPITLFVVANPAARYLRWLDELPRDVTVVAGLDPDIFAARREDAEVLLAQIACSRRDLEPILSMAPNVKWLHSLSAGVDSLLFPALVDSPITFTNSAGVYAGSLAEWAISSILFFAKDLKRLMRNQAARRWEEFDVQMLAGSTLGVLGYGGIGQATARLAKAFGMRIAAMRRRPQRSEGDGVADEVFTPDRKMEFLSQCDYVVASMPLTAETHHFIGEPELRAMKDGAVLVNVGRGPVVDEAALMRGLKAGWIRGAALDVFESEPLPQDHPFYAMENLLMSPHSADHTPEWKDDTMRFFLQNFERYHKGEPLLNIVDKRAGY